MNNKSEESYNEVFTKLNELCMLTLRNIIIDFEMALKNSLTNAFKEARIYGCAFHFGQMIWRALQRFKLAFEYKNNQIFNKSIR